MAKDRHSRDYYIRYAREHPWWCKAHWYLSEAELKKLKNESANKVREFMRNQKQEIKVINISKIINLFEL